MKINIRKHKLNKMLLVACFMAAIFGLLTNIIYREFNKNYYNSDGEIVVIFENDLEQNALEEMVMQLGVNAKVLRHIEDYALISTQTAKDYRIAIKKLENNPRVLDVQGNVNINTLSFSSDTYADKQWAIQNNTEGIVLTDLNELEEPSLQGIDMDVVEAWDTLAQLPQQKREVVVAVIDTGVDYMHPDLYEHMWINVNEIADDEIDNDNNGYIDDVYGWDFYNDDASVCHYEYSTKYKRDVASKEDNDDHGTHIAGIIGATADNGIGIAGIASNVNVKIMSLKINGGSDSTGVIANAIEAIKYATMMGADICNLSWGTTQYLQTLEKVMAESDMLFVAAAGNSGGNNNNKPIYPANLPLDNIISVTFINKYGKLTKYSNIGNKTVDVAAPGDDIYSTIVGSYSSMSGSSMAAPQVAGVAAMVYAYSDHLYASNIKELLMSTVKELPELDGKIINAGIPSAYQAVKAEEYLNIDTIPPSMSFKTSYNKGDMTVHINRQDEGGSQIRSLRWSLGEKTIKDFARGVKGTPIEKNEITVSKSGLYSFYASDYAGNETVQIYKVEEDTKAPKISIAYIVASNYKSRTITVRATDLLSGLKRVEYMAGVHKAEAFLPANAGTKLELTEGKGTFKVKKDGTYTIFATDNRGNMAVKTVKIKTVKATSLKLKSTTKTMKVNDKFTLKATIAPLDTTDRLFYTSSNEDVAIVSNSGKVTALKEGKATITIKTYSGLKATCKIVVKPITYDSSQ